MVCLLSRNPLLRLLLYLWWLPVLVPPLLWFCLTPHVPGPLPYSGSGAVVYGAALAGIITAMWLHATAAALREGVRHGSKGHRFLCPYCLRFGEFRFACRACGGEVAPAIVHTRGVYVNDCSHCDAFLFSRDGEEGEGVQAWCRHCSRVCEWEIHHERQVHVVGVVRERDFAALCGALGVRPERTRGGIDRACHDDGARLTLLLCLAQLPGFVELLPATHALWSVERIWLDGHDVEPLRLGEAVDRFLRRAGLSTARRQAMRICVGGEIPDGVARRLLAARFGTIVGGVSPLDLIGAAAPHVPAPPAPVGAIERW